MSWSSHLICRFKNILTPVVDDKVHQIKAMVSTINYYYYFFNSYFQLIEIISICWLKILKRYNHIASTWKHWFQCCAKEWGIFILPKCLFHKFESLDGKIWWWPQFLVCCPVSVQYMNEIPAHFLVAVLLHLINYYGVVYFILVFSKDVLGALVSLEGLEDSPRI